MSLISTINKSLVKVFGSRNQRLLKELWKVVEQVNSFEDGLKKLSDEKLAQKTDEFRNRLADGETLDQLLPEAFAVVRESSFRHLKTPTGIPMRHFDVQIIGGTVLHRGMIAEMATGEGKTLVATLPSYLNALEGKGVHVITVNDYLAQRDRDWMAPLYESMGMSVGAIVSSMDPGDRKEQYLCDITYGTNSEFGFDYLRDNMKVHKEQQAQQGRLNYTIIDEVDSILIDEARTPLIISGTAERSSDKYYTANRVAKRLKRGLHFEIKEKEKAVYFTEEGIEAAEKLVGVDSFYSGQNMEWPHILEQALRAHHLYTKDVEYVVRDGEIVIVDEFTGRLMEGRTWSEGLHQAIEAKENLKTRQENQTLATITLQNYFKLYNKISGMTGTALTEASEFYSIYNLEVVAVPTNRPNQRIDAGDVIYRTAREKYHAIAQEIEEVNQQGRPILLGTTSIEKTELIAGMLTRRGIKHEVLNAKNHGREADIIKDAGQEGRVTISTNMAGRGTDIVLGDGIIEKGGLHVIGTERHESRRIDNQLRGRCARQGDPGSSKFFLSLEDDLMRRFASDKVGAIFKKIGMKEGEEISHPWVTKSIQRAQKKVESYFFDIRKNLLEYDGVMNEQRKLVYGERQEILEGENLSEKVLLMAEKSIFRAVPSIISFVPTPLTEDEEEDENTQAQEDEAPVQEQDPERDLREWAKNTYDLTLPDDLGVPAGAALEEHSTALSELVLDLYEKRYKERREELGEEMITLIERFVLLKFMDDKWKDHLHAMDHLRASIGLRSYGQIDPKIAYKQEGYQMFNEMLESLNQEVSQMVLRVQVKEEDEEELGTDLEGAQYRAPAEAVGDQGGGSPEQQVTESHGGESNSGPVEPIVNKGPKVGRNDPCPCGSGKKHKKCCGK